jgi:hypothetical protein
MIQIAGEMVNIVNHLGKLSVNSVT